MWEQTSPFSSLGVYVAFKVWKASSERAVRSAREDEFAVVVVVVVVWDGLHVSASEDSESERPIPSRPVSRVSSAMMVPGFLSLW